MSPHERVTHPDQPGNGGAGRLVDESDALLRIREEAQVASRDDVMLMSWHGRPGSLSSLAAVTGAALRDESGLSQPVPVRSSRNGTAGNCSKVGAEALQEGALGDEFVEQ